MTLAIIYWVLMLLWAIFGVFPSFPRATVDSKGRAVGWAPFGGSLLLFILLLILGWAQFGSPIKG